MLRNLTFLDKLEGGGGGMGISKIMFLKGQYLCKIESNAEGKERDTQHFKNLKRPNI
jgi:hypothetical protein